MVPKANYLGGKLHWAPAALDADNLHVQFSCDRHHIVFANWMRKAFRKLHGGDLTLSELGGFTSDVNHYCCVCDPTGTVTWPQWVHLAEVGQTDKGFFDLAGEDLKVKVDLAAVWTTFSCKLPNDARVRRDAAGRANGPIFIECKRTSLLSPVKGDPIGTWHFHLWYEDADGGEPLVFEFNPGANGRMKQPSEVRSRTYLDANVVGIAAARQAAYDEKGWQGYRGARASGPPPAYTNLAGPSAPQPARPHEQHLSPPPTPAPPPAPGRPPPPPPAPAQISEASDLINIFGAAQTSPVLVGDIVPPQPQSCLDEELASLTWGPSAADFDEAGIEEERQNAWRLWEATGEKWSKNAWMAKSSPPVKSPPSHPPMRAPPVKAPPAPPPLPQALDDLPVLVGPLSSRSSASTWEVIGIDAAAGHQQFIKMD